LKPRIAFLGLGTMGVPMAKNLASAGFTLSVYNRSAGRAAGLLELGARVAASPYQAATDADLVITMLTGAEAVERVLFGPEGAALAEPRGKLFIDMSTTGAAPTKDFAQRLSALDARFVDAPVSGSRLPAETGELVVLAGGEASDLAELDPVFRPLARRVIHAGPVGAGQTLKVVLNGLGCQHLLAFASMLRLGERAGLTREVLLTAFTAGAFATPAYVAKQTRVLAGRYEDPDFVLELVLRDAVLCDELQRELGMPMPTHQAAHAEVRRAVLQGLGPDDLFGIERLYGLPKTHQKG
jgi:3-hydroxyisobutyrate dehydrogenase-like beta-hydroxyacid dehydrogenase